MEGERRAKSFNIESISWCLTGRGGKDRSRKPAPKHKDSYGEGFVSAKASARTLKNFERVTSQAWLEWQCKEETGVNNQSSGENVVSSYEVSVKATQIQPS